MAVVRDNNKWNADTLTELQGLGSDDGVTADVVAWAVDQNNWYYPNVINAGTSTWTALATGGASASAGLEGNIYENLVGYIDPADRNSYPGTGTTVVDLEGNLTSGALAGTASYQEGAFDFTGTSGDQLSFTKGAATDDIFATGGTIIAFVRPDAAGTEGRIVDTTDALAEGYSLFVSSAASSRVYFSFRRQAASVDGEWRAADVTVPGISTVQRPLPLGGWACVAVVYSDATPTTAPTFYLNGVTLGSTLISTLSGAVGSDAGNPFVIGEVSTNTNTLNGAVGPILLFDRALAVNEVRQAMNAFAARYGILVHQPHESSIRGAESVVAGGDRTGTASFAGALTVRGGDADDGLASGGLGPGGYLLLRGGDYTGTVGGAGGSVELRSGDGRSASSVLVHAGDVAANATAGDVSVYGGSNSGGGFPGDVLVRGGVSLADNSNSRRQGDVTVRGGEALTDGDATTQSGNHQGGNVTLRGGDGTNLANAGSVTIRAGNVDTSITNLEGGDVSITGGTSTGNREGGQINITAGINSTGSGTGGPLNLTGGIGGATGVGGAVTVTGGAGGSASGTGGAVTVKGGAPGAASASPGAISLSGGDGNSSAGANASLTGGIGSGAFAGGVATVQGGTGGVGGAGGATTVRGGTGGTGATTGGLVSVLGGTPGATGNGGSIAITGGPGGSTSGNGGDITLTPGSVTSGTVGSIILDYATWPAADGSNGFVLTTDGAGALSWAAGGGGGSANAGLEGVFYNGLTFYMDANDRNSYSGTGTSVTDLINTTSGTISGVQIVQGHFNYNAATDDISFGAVVASETQDIFDGGGTVEFWVRPETDGFGTGGIIVTTADDTTTEGWTVRVNTQSGTTVNLTLLVGHSTTQGSWSIDNALEVGQWYHVVVVYNDDATTNDPTIYVNAVAAIIDTETTPVGTYGSDSGNTLFVGGNTGGTNAWEGDLDVVRFYDRSLSSQEVQQLFRVMQDRLLPSLVSPGPSSVLTNATAPPITLSTGAGLGTGGGGSFVATLGDGGSGGGTGGSWNVNTGSGTASGSAGGGFNVTVGQSVSATGTSIAMTAGTTTAGTGGSFLLTAPDGTTGGGGFICNTGTASGSGNGGIFEITLGSGPDDDGYFDLDPDWTGDGSHYIQLTASGTNTSNVTQIFTGNRDPNTSVSGFPGSLYLRGNSTTSALYVNTTSGTSAGTTWSAVGGTTAPTQWQEVTTQTTGTGAGSETFTLATVVQPLASNDQTWVEVRVIGEDASSPSTHTFFTRELRTYYRGAGSTTLWSNEVVGAEQNRGFGSEITSVDLAISGNDVIVQLTMSSSTRTVDWTVQYITKSTVTASSSGTSATAGQVLTFDNRGNALQTGSATASGGTVDFTMDVGASYGELKYLRVRTATGTCADADVEFYRDSARTDLIYDAQNKDTSTTNGWVDRNPATMMGDDGSALASNTLYGRIRNNDAGAASFNVELVFWSDGNVAGTSGGVLEYTTGAAKTSAYTAAAGEHVRYSTSGGAFTITMPANPAPNDRVGVVETAGSTTTLTVSGNGNNIVDSTTSSVTTAATLSSTYTSVVWKWDATSSVWRIE